MEEELTQDYWTNMCLAEFWSKYDLVYRRDSPKLMNSRKTNLIPLLFNRGFIRRRSQMAVLRYYLSYENDEDTARGLLILFFPLEMNLKRYIQKM